MKHFFTPKGILFRLILLLTLGLWGYNLYHFNHEGASIIVISHYLLSALGTVLIIFAFIPWYGFKYKGLGIEDHYEKILLPTTYLLLIYNILGVYGLHMFSFNILLLILFIFFVTINFIMLFYHFRDKGKAPPSYFAANLYLKDRENQAPYIEPAFSTDDQGAAKSK